MTLDSAPDGWAPVNGSGATPTVGQTIQLEIYGTFLTPVLDWIFFDNARTPCFNALNVHTNGTWTKRSAFVSPQVSWHQVCMLSCSSIRYEYQFLQGGMYHVCFISHTSGRIYLLEDLIYVYPTTVRISSTPSTASLPFTSLSGWSHFLVNATGVSITDPVFITPLQSCSNVSFTEDHYGLFFVDNSSYGIQAVVSPHRRCTSNCPSVFVKAFLPFSGLNASICLGLLNNTRMYRVEWNFGVFIENATYPSLQYFSDILNVSVTGAGFQRNDEIAVTLNRLNFSCSSLSTASRLHNRYDSFATISQANNNSNSSDSTWIEFVDSIRPQRFRIVLQFLVGGNFTLCYWSAANHQWAAFGAVVVQEKTTSSSTSLSLTASFTTCNVSVVPIGSLSDLGFRRGDLLIGLSVFGSSFSNLAVSTVQLSIVDGILDQRYSGLLVVKQFTWKREQLVDIVLGQVSDITLQSPEFVLLTLKPQLFICPNGSASVQVLVPIEALLIDTLKKASLYVGISAGTAVIFASIGLVGVAAIPAQMSTVISQLSCRSQSDRLVLGQSLLLIAPFRKNIDPASLLVPNLIITICLPAAHAAVVLFWTVLQHRDVSKWRAIASSLGFPHLSISFGGLFYCGLMFGATRLVLDDGSTIANMILGVFGTVVGLGIPVGLHVLLRREPSVKFVKDSNFSQNSLLRSFLSPIGFWDPVLFSRMWYPMIADVGPASTWFSTMPFFVCFITCTIANFPSHIVSKLCYLQSIALTSLFVVCALIVYSAHPFRSKALDAIMVLCYLSLAVMSLTTLDYSSRSLTFFAYGSAAVLVSVVLKCVLLLWTVLLHDPWIRQLEAERVTSLMTSRSSNLSAGGAKKSEGLPFFCATRGEDGVLVYPHLSLHPDFQGSPRHPVLSGPMEQINFHAAPNDPLSSHLVEAPPDLARQRRGSFSSEEMLQVDEADDDLLSRLLDSGEEVPHVVSTANSVDLPTPPVTLALRDRRFRKNSPALPLFELSSDDELVVDSTVAENSRPENDVSHSASIIDRTTEGKLTCPHQEIPTRSPSTMSSFRHPVLLHFMDSPKRRRMPQVAGTFVLSKASWQRKREALIEKIQQQDCSLNAALDAIGRPGI